MFHPSPILLFFFFNDTATTEIYTLSLHDALPISPAFHPSGRCGCGSAGVVAANGQRCSGCARTVQGDRNARTRSEEHTSELQSLAYLVCRLLLEKKKNNKNEHTEHC